MNQTATVDCKEIAQSIKGQKPPFTCPVCLKEYRSLTGILYHIGQFGPPTAVPRCVLGDESYQGTPSPYHPGSPGGTVRRRARRELTWGEAQQLVEVEFDNNYRRVEIDNDLEITRHSDKEEEREELMAGASPVIEAGVASSGRKRGGKPRTPLKRGRGSTGGSNDTPNRPGKLASTSLVKNKGKRKSKLKMLGKGETNITLPSAEINTMENLDFPDAPARESSYYRFVEQSAEDLDENVEYDMDEEDYQWLSLINEERKTQGLTAVPQDVFEILMDRLEKECIFESHTFGEGTEQASKNMYNIDENAVCVICNDGECHNTNAILFCDMCNLAVHQECYGVPYIPEGQWLCRRCIESPSRGVDCALCPNKGGAFKRTLDARWAHVICAVWIPEVQFANPVFLEPIDGIKEIPAARWKLTCYVCCKRMGACIQCAKANCYVAFHVTCAQQASLYMKLDVVKGGEIRKTAYCDSHTPPAIKRKLEKEAREMEKAKGAQGDGKGDKEGVTKEEEEVVVEVEEERRGNGVKTRGSRKEAEGEEEEVGEGERGGEGEGEGVEEEEDGDFGKHPRIVSSGVRKARQMMEEKRYNVPVVSIPFVPQHRLDHIISQVSVHKKSQFIPKLVSYWKLKRQSRNGVPLLRRLQANKGQRANTTNLTKEEKENLAEQLTLWKSLRHDLERARLLIELVRKREKLKREQLHLLHTIGELQLRPLNLVVKRMLDRISRKDPAAIFAKPVSIDDVPDYLDVIKKPMDFTTMRKKVEENGYNSLDDFERDFRLVWSNATIYNQKDTIYYKAAIRIKEAGQTILDQAREQLVSAGVDSKSGLHDPDVMEPPPLTPSSISKGNQLLPLDDLLEVNDESMLESFRDRHPSTTSQAPLDEQVDFLQEKLQVMRQSGNSRRKQKEKSLRRELSALRRQIRNEMKGLELENPDSGHTLTPPRSPRRYRSSSTPRNAEELASHLLHGSLRMTPSRQQILSYSGIRLEERASAMQKEEEEGEGRRREEGEDVLAKKGRGRLYSSSDSMLLKSVHANLSHQQQRTGVCLLGDSGGGGNDAKGKVGGDKKERRRREEEEGDVSRRTSSSGSSSSSSSSSEGGEEGEEFSPGEEDEDEEEVIVSKRKRLTKLTSSEISENSPPPLSPPPPAKRKKDSSHISSSADRRGMVQQKLSQKEHSKSSLKAGASSRRKRKASAMSARPLPSRRRPKVAMEEEEEEDEDVILKKKKRKKKKKGKSDFYVESLKKARNIKRKKLQRTDEGGESVTASFESTHRRRRGGEKGLSKNTANIAPSASIRVRVQTRLRLRSMDTVSSDSDGGGGGERRTVQNGIESGKNRNGKSRKSKTITVAEAAPPPPGSLVTVATPPPSGSQVVASASLGSLVVRSSCRKRTPSKAEASRTNRSKSSSCLEALEPGEGNDDVGGARRKEGEEEGRRKRRRRRSSKDGLPTCFSDSEIKGYHKGSGLSMPNASSVEDLTAMGGGARSKGYRGDDRWGEKGLLTKRKLSSSSDDIFSAKRQRVELSSERGGGGEGRRRGEEDVPNGRVMVNGVSEGDINPMDLVWAKCRGYPPYPALVIDPDIPPEGISLLGETIKAPSDEVLELQSRTPTATYLVRFFDGRRTWQWLPQEKIEHLGVTQEGDNIKLGMAGHSKRSVREAYSRAKKWLRQKSLSMSSPCDGKKGCKSMDTTSEAEMTDPNTNDVNTTDSRNDKARYET